MFSQTSNSASAGGDANYVEDVFSTYLYTGNGSTQTITNGIDLSTKGGLVWVKNRNSTGEHALFDTARGVGNWLTSNSTVAQYASTSTTAFLSSGFSLANGTYVGEVNQSGSTYASWTFRKQPKFFDVVTYTGNGVAGRQIAHSLGSVPGCIIVKRTDAADNWYVGHRSLGGYQNYLFLNLTNATATNGLIFDSTAPTSTVFTVGSGNGTNANGGTYVAYLFAHDAGGFGASGSDNVISCGSYTGNGSATGPTITLGYEPQWVLIKNSTSANDWHLFDVMRGMAVSDGADARLIPNLSNAELLDTALSPTATGFVLETSSARYNASGDTYIYIAIRRGPMKTPTTGTSVFSPIAVNNSAGTTNTTNFPIDFQWYGNRDGTANNIFTIDRLRGVSTTSSGQQNYLSTSKTNAEVTSGGSIVSRNWNNTGFQTSTAADGANAVYWNLRRAPGFFDVVCYTGNGVSGTTQTHNLGVSPQIVIIKSRSMGGSQYPWLTNVPGVGIGFLNTTDPVSGGTLAVSSTTFTLGNANNNNEAGTTYVAYLFASVPGVSKVGSYTGNGSSQTINCGFTGGARFVLIKRTDIAGDWYVWDSARGIVSANDPHLSLNTTAAEVTTDDSIDPDSSGFIVNQVAATNINVSGGSYIFLAIA